MESLASVSQFGGSFFSAVLAPFNFANIKRTTNREDEPAATDAAARLGIIVPVAALSPRIDTLVAKLADQDYPDYEVVVVYESIASDYQIVAQSRIQYVKRSSAATSGQSRKSANMLLGMASLTSSPEWIIFIDDDIIITNTFLAHIRQELANHPHSIVTSYRHFTEATGLAGIMLAACNNFFATLMRIRRWRCVWGGCFGFHRSIIAKLDLLAILSEAISDDLEITSAARSCRVPVVVSPRPLSWSTQFVHTIPELAAWGLRQFRLGRFYASRMFRDAFWISSSAVIATIWVLVNIAITNERALVLVTMLILFVIVGSMAFTQSRHFELRPNYLIVGAILSLIPFITLALCIAAMMGETIEWKGTCYTLARTPNADLRLRNSAR